jgi:two-component system, OmpR family, phosphate regulon sensor histidine kinase PhoR
LHRAPVGCGGATFSFSVNLLVVLLLALLGVAMLLIWLERARLRAAEDRHARELEDQRISREAEVRAQVLRTSALFDRMIEGVIVVDATGRVRLANRAAGALFAFAPPATGRTLLEATRHHEVSALITRLGREPEVLNHELRFDGVSSTRYLQVNALALRATDGAPDGAILVFHDLTRLRQLEAVRQEFVANVSHELRTPLSLIKSAAETLIDGGKNDPTTLGRFLEIIDKHANRLTLLIDDLLLLARLDSGRVDLRIEPFLVRSLAQEALDDYALLAKSRGVTLKNTIPAGLMALGDSDRLRQVISNLVDNAIKYGRVDGNVGVSARALDGGAVELGVRDDGPGIPLEARTRIFERFYRVDKARSREQGGTGLGLAIVKNVMQAHGGEVRVESAPGVGTEFFLTLPGATPEAD